MIARKELVADHLWDSLSADEQFNINILHYKLNYVRKLYNHVMIVTSGYRTKKDHEKIYAEINTKRELQDKEKIKTPMKSFHLRGAAADIYDPMQRLQKWINENMDVIESLNLHLEHFDATPNWVHFQIYPPLSGKTLFFP